MSLTKCTADTDVISELADEPAMSATELKAKFDEAGRSIKNYLNDTLTAEVDSLVAKTNMGSESKGKFD